MNEPPLLQETGDCIERLKVTAFSAGATGVAQIAARDIVVRDELAERCLEPRCENYGKSMSGFGIDVAALFKAAGWKMTWVMRVEEASPTKMANVSALVLLD